MFDLAKQCAGQCSSVSASVVRAYFAQIFAQTISSKLNLLKLLKCSHIFPQKLHFFERMSYYVFLHLYQ